MVITGPALRIWPGARNTPTRRGARGEELSGERISTVGPALCVTSRSRSGLAAGNHIDRRALVQRLPHTQEQVELDARPVLVELRGQADLDHGRDVLRRALAPAQELDELVGEARLAQLESSRHPPSLSEESRFFPLGRSGASLPYPHCARARRAVNSRPLSSPHAGPGTEAVGGAWRRARRPRRRGWQGLVRLHP